MLESIKHIVIVLSCLILTTPLFCQNSISYSYDSAGNRISRVTSTVNIASTFEKPHGFHQVTITSNIMSPKTIYVLEDKWQSGLIRFYAHKSSQQESDSRIEDYLVHIKLGASKKNFDQFALNYTLLQGRNDALYHHRYEIR